MSETGTRIIGDTAATADTEGKPAAKRRAASRGPEFIGWREHVALPDFGIRLLPAKIDTGARTSALHAVRQEVFERDGARWIAFTIPRHGARKAVRVSAPILDEREIRNTSGVAERRFVIRTTLLMGRHRWLIEVSLANRKKMEFDLILGRTAIRRRRILVDPGRSFLAGRPKKRRKPAMDREERA